MKEKKSHRTERKKERNQKKNQNRKIEIRKTKIERKTLERMKIVKKYRNNEEERNKLGKTKQKERN